MNEPKINITVMPGAQMNGYVKEQNNYFGPVQQIVQGNAPVEGKPKAARRKKEAGDRPPKPRETMTFKRKSGVTDAHLLVLLMKLTKEQWIDGNEADFKALFSGKRDEDCQLTWKAPFGKGTLVGLFKRLAEEGLIVVPLGFTLPAILEGHFEDKNGQWLTGLDKGDSCNDKALPFIDECVKLLKTDIERLVSGVYDDEDFRSEYDRYDQQDLHLHKK
ncbi:MAG: hypothetical protein IKO85_04270 [Bacteroidaceae bacterium]|nr:hypothetical protein [Bacteroidaceae bacterium]